MKLELSEFLHSPFNKSKILVASSDNFRMSVFLVYTFTILVGWKYYCSSDLIRLPSITGTDNEECIREKFLQKGKSSIQCVLDSFNRLDTPGTRPILVSENFGTCNQGIAWDDGILSHQPATVGIQQIQIFFGDRINSIQVTYLLANGMIYDSPIHGGETGHNASITLNEGERLVRIEGRRESSSGITQLVFISKNSSGSEKTHGPYGQENGTLFTVEGYILGFRGYSSSEVHGLGVYYLPALRKSREAFGGTGRDIPFDDNVDSIIPPVISIKNITINHGSLLDGIQCNYIQLGGSIYEGRHNGGTGGDHSTVVLQDKEVLNRIVIKEYYSHIGQLILHTTLNNQSVMHGPYGSSSMMGTHEFSGNIIGFYGFYSFPHSLDIVSKIGVYTV